MHKPKMKLEKKMDKVKNSNFVGFTPHCLKNYKIPLEKKSPKNGATADKIDS